MTSRKEGLLVYPSRRGEIGQLGIVVRCRVRSIRRRGVCSSGVQESVREPLLFLIRGLEGAQPFMCPLKPASCMCVLFVRAYARFLLDSLIFSPAPFLSLKCRWTTPCGTRRPSRQPQWANEESFPSRNCRVRKEEGCLDWPGLRRSVDPRQRDDHVVSITSKLCLESLAEFEVDAGKVERQQNHWIVWWFLCYI